MKKKSKRKIKRGYCAKCGARKSVKGKKCCEVCLEKERNYQRKRRTNLKILGLCSCGKPLSDKNSTWCEDCKAKRREKYAKHSEECEKLGVCVRCGRETYFGMKQCEICNAEAITRKENWKNKNPEKAKMIEDKARAKMLEKALENGLCRICFSRKASEGYVTCLDCRVREKKRYIERRKGMETTETRKYMGLCRCGKPLMEGKKLCKDCYDEICRRAAKGRATLAEKRRIENEEREKRMIEYEKRKMEVQERNNEQTVGM